MKSTLLVGTVAATLVSTLNAEVFVLGASWRERALTAPDGRIDRQMRNAAAPRGYVIVEKTPEFKAAFIEYRNDRVEGKSYTITNDFTGFTADLVKDQSATTNRIFGQILTPVTVADVPDAMMSFSGSTFGTTKPRRVVFDKEVFQTGDSTALPGPNMVEDGDMKRSLLAGSASDLVVSSTSLAGALQELETRLIDANYVRTAVAPEILVEPVAPPTRVGYDPTQTLTVTLDPDTYSATSTTYAWFKGDAPGGILVGTAPTFMIPGGAAGDGTYYLVVTNEAGSDTSTSTVIPPSTPVTLAFTNTPSLPAGPLAVGINATVPLSAPTNANALPRIAEVGGYQWEKSTTNATTGFTAVLDGLGGKLASINVTGNATGNGTTANGPAWYRLTLKTDAPVQTLVSTVVQVTTAP